MKDAIRFLVLVSYGFMGTLNAQTTDSVTDSRDGQTYETVEIGDQWWMAENLNIGTRISGGLDQTDNAIIEKYSFNNHEPNSDTYGGLYQWREAMSYSDVEGTQGICLDGWHIPTDAEWKTLEMHLGMSQGEADSIGWRGTDQGTELKVGGSSGFNALFAGYRNLAVSFLGMGTHAFFWSSSWDHAGHAWYRALVPTATTVGRGDPRDMNFGLCVRCVMNDTMSIENPGIRQSIREYQGANSIHAVGCFDLSGSRSFPSGTGVYLILNGNRVTKRISGID